jgi:hypothetical protein
LALLTRVRSVLVATGALDATRLYDLRAFKTVWAEYAYVYRLAAGGRHGGTAVTSMGQLVAGMARELHPAWKMTSYWEDRDRHQRSVRRRLSTLAAMGLLRWTIGVDEDLEERRTLLELLPVPELLPAELAAAAERLERWEGRYAPDLNTDSEIGIADVKRAAAPLSASERQRRGCCRSRRRAAARRASVGSQTISAPPVGAPPEVENNSAVDPSPPYETATACGTRTGVTRASVDGNSDVTAAISAVITARRGSGAGPNVGTVVDCEAVVARVEAARRAREPVLEVIARQVVGRSHELAGWSLERDWPRSRLSEAWACARYGARWVAQHGSAAGGRISCEEYRRLRYAVARFERFVAARPEGFPAGGLAALLYLGQIAAGEGERAPRLLGFAIGRLAQIGRRMRAVATRHDPARVERAERFARERRAPVPPREPGRAGRRIPGSEWPRWLERDEAGRPFFLEGKLQVNEDAIAWPGYQSSEYHAVLRDMYLLCYGRLAVNLDGRGQMAARCALLEAGEDRAPAGPYPRRAGNEQRKGGRERVDRDVVELAQRTGMALNTARAVSAKTRSAILVEERRREAEAIRREALAAFPFVGPAPRDC